MRSRIAHLGVLALGVLALLGTTTPPAVAHTDADIVFTADVRLDQGIDAPATGLGLPTFPAPTVVMGLPLQGDIVSTHGHVEWDAPHNRRTASVSSTLCTITGVQGLNKQPPKTPGPFEHDCGFGGTGFVQGYCGLSGGQFKDFVLSDALGQTYDIDIHYSDTGGGLTLTGHWRKRNNPSQHGKIVGEGVFTPTQGNCFDKTATTFSVIASATMTQDLTLLPPL